MTSAATIAEGDAAISDLIKPAALVGWFEPLTLIASVPEEKRDVVLSALAALSEEYRIGKRMCWRLTPQARRSTLSSIQAGPELDKLLQTAKPEKDDTFGRSLLDVLSKPEIDIRKLEREQLQEFYRAFEFAKLVTEAQQARIVSANTNKGRGVLPKGAGAPGQGGKAPQPSSTDVLWAEIGRRESDAALAPLSSFFLGREGELALIEQYVASGGVQAPQPKPDWLVHVGTPDPNGAAPVLLTGIGGVGKSAIITQLIQVQRKNRWGGTPIVVLDFDRPMLAGADAVEMTAEFTRQLALAHDVEVSALLSKFRVDLRRDYADQGGSGSSFEVAQSVVARHLSVLRDALMNRNIAERPIVLLLDTFEEVMVRGEAPTRYVLRWAAELKTTAGLQSLRVVLAGRVAPHELVTDLKSEIVAHIELKDLPPDIAERVLQGLLIDPDRTRAKDSPVRKRPPLSPSAGKTLAVRLVKVFGGNPLVLRILSQFCRDKTPLQIETFADEASRGGNNAFSGALAQAFLYARILERVDDPKVRALAHPGLVLRRVTKVLLQEVLAKPCGLGDVDDKEAEKLIDKLSRYVWLVSKDSGGVRHRPDLRRLMLPILLGRRELPGASDDPKSKERQDRINNAKLINQRAIEYFTLREMEGDREAEVERTYHELLQDDPPLGLLSEIPPSFANAIGEDINSLDDKPRAFVKFRAGRELDEAEIALLPPDIQDRILGRRAAGARKKGATRRQIKEQIKEDVTGVAASAPAVSSASTDLSSALPFSDDDIYAAFAEGEFVQLSSHLSRCVDEATNGFAYQQSEERFAGFTASGQWRIFLGSLAVDPEMIGGRLEPLGVEERLRKALAATAQRHGRSDHFASATFLFAVLKAFMPQRAADCAGAFCEAFGIAAPQKGAIADAFDLRVVLLQLGAAELSRSKRLAVANIDDVSLLRYLDLLYGAPIGLPNAVGWAYGPRDPSKFQMRLIALPTGPSDRKDRYQQPDGALHTFGVRGDFKSFTVPLDMGSDIAGIARFLRGRTPELYSPIRVALQDGLDTGVVLDLAREVASRAPVWPEELGADRLPSALNRDPATWISTLIEFADRCGLLAETLRIAAELSPGPDQRIGKVKALMAAYDRLLMSGLVADPGTRERNTGT